MAIIQYNAYVDTELIYHYLSSKFSRAKVSFDLGNQFLSISLKRICTLLSGSKCSLSLEASQKSKRNALP
jgi:hypothetical protein